MDNNDFESKYWRFIERDKKYHRMGEEFAKDCIENFDPYTHNDPEELELMDRDPYLSDYIGSVMSIFPSGKYYMFWCSNFTWLDAAQDYCFREGMESVLDESDYWLESGEGDPTDLFICKGL